jgi:U3 small nucleolar RNA-associated protein 4
VASSRLLVGWWDREIHIWKLRQSFQEANSTGLESDDGEQNCKKDCPRLGRIFIKGESNITSCSVSRDGSVLIVSTATAIKAFHLTVPDLDLDEKLKIREMSVPSKTISTTENAGATKVQISPNGRWLAWIEEGTQVRIAEISRDESGPSIQLHSAKLTRLRRDIPKHVRLGGLGNYERHITHITFSPDSNVLAAADLAGYIDTWIMRESVGQYGEAPAEDDGESSSDEENGPGAGSPWVRNPKALLIPKLANAPVALSFSNDPIAPILRDEGEEGPDDYILLAVTATSRIYTFNPLEGSLTKWSRRNAVWKLPEEIRSTRDLIKGVVWAGSRIWMYGVSFVFMVDLAFDFTEQESGASKKNRKRKRGADSGAGSKTEIGTLAPQPVRTLVARDGQEGEWLDVEMADAEPQADASGDEDDNVEEEIGGRELEKLRKREQRCRSEGEDNAPPSAEKLRKKWWHTYKYRPILGIVPLVNAGVGEGGETNGVNGSSKKAAREIKKIEVALVERPKEDIALPERYVED